jgi:O-antigen/teichoic acid export membrane protein/GT2 family glycosyltransferase
MAERDAPSDANGSPLDVVDSFCPVRVFEVELSRRLEPEPIVASIRPAAYRRGMVLVRLHGPAIGTVEVDLEAGRVPPVAMAEAVWDKFATEIDEHLREDGLGPQSSLPPGGLDAARCIHPIRQSQTGHPFITVVVPTRDRPAQLERCLSTLLAMDYPSYEVLVVDNAPSGLGGKDVVDAMQPDPRLRYLVEPTPGSSRARNLGLAEARGEIVAFTDDDVAVDRLWLAALADCFSAEPQPACATGLVLPARLDSEAQRWFEEYGGFNKGFHARRFDLGDHRSDDPFYPYAAGMFGSGNNVAFRTDVLRSLGGYDSALGPGTPAKAGEDLSLFLSVITSGRLLAYTPDAVVYHDHREGHQELISQLRSYGVGLSAMLTRQALASPLHLAAIVRRVPGGVVAVVDPRSRKNAKRSPSFPRDLARAEMAGLLTGPFAYARARVSARLGARRQEEPSLVLQRLVARARLHLSVPLFHNAYALVATTLITSILGVAYWALAARHYSPEEVGRAATAISTMVLLSGIAQLNLISALPRFLPTAGQGTRKFILNAYAVTASLAAVGTLAFVAVTHQTPLGIQGASGWTGVAWFVLAVVSWCIFTLQDSVLTGLRQAIWVPVENGAFAVIKIILLLLLASTAPHGGIFASWTIPVALSLIPVNALIFRRLIPRRGPAAEGSGPPPRRQLASYISGDYLGGLLQLASITLLPLLVATRLGLASAGHFYAAWVVASSFDLILSNLGMALVVEGATDEVRMPNLSRKMARLGLLSVIPAAAVAALLAPQLLSLLGRDYASEAAILLRLVSIGVIFRAAIVLYLSISRVRRRIRRVIVVQLALCCGVLGLSSMLIGPLGLTGVGVAYLISQAAVGLAVLPGVTSALIGSGGRLNVADAVHLASSEALAGGGGGG